MEVSARHETTKIEGFPPFSLSPPPLLPFFFPLHCQGNQLNPRRGSKRGRDEASFFFSFPFFLFSPPPPPLSLPVIAIVEKADSKEDLPLFPPFSFFSPFLPATSCWVLSRRDYERLRCDKKRNFFPFPFFSPFPSFPPPPPPPIFQIQSVMRACRGKVLSKVE